MFTSAFNGIGRKAVLGVQIACFGHLVTEWLGSVSMCHGYSMSPTFDPQMTLVLIERLKSLGMGKVEIGNVVASVSPIDPGRYILKRVVAKEGDVICVDPFEKTPRYTKIPKGHVWLQGDNYSNSSDSRTFGPVPIALLRGRVVCKLLPDFEILKQ